jgi:hypothetical protein
MKGFSKNVMRSVYRDLFAIETPALLSRDEFVLKYMPKYARAYSLPTGIRLHKNGRPKMVCKGTFQTQITKRNNIIDSVYSQYVWARQNQIDFDANSRSRQAAGI